MRRKHGFTMVELMTTIAILAVLSAMAVPALRDFIRRTQASSTANTLLTSMALARSEAARRNGRVTVCPSSDGATCGTDWAQGWIIFQDDSTARQVDTGDEIYQKFPSAPSTAVFTQTISRVSFLGSGIREVPSVGPPDGNCFEFIVGALEDSRRYVRVSVNGGTRTGKGVCT